ncbi:hypothetical protein [Streptomyces sp. NPDC060010]|uniref:hypothetical protein n=1 Tax=Streptomyces sp. NPDC060010 TaxID=3347036 RepID=UPI0036779BEA
MQITHLDGLGPVTAVIRSIGVRHDGAHQLVTDGLYLDLSNALRNPAHQSAMRYLLRISGCRRVVTVHDPCGMPLVCVIRRVGA